MNIVCIFDDNEINFGKKESVANDGGVQMAGSIWSALAFKHEYIREIKRA
jgi:hypothetical protein